MTLKAKLQSLKILLLNMISLKAALTAAALVVIAVILFWLMPSTDSGTKQAAQEVQKLSENIRRYYQNRPDYWGLSTKTAIEKKIAPMEMIKSDGLRNFYGTEVTTGNGEEGTMLMPGTRNFDVAYKGLSRRQCIELSSYKFDEKFWMGVGSVTIKNSQAKTDFSWSDEKNKLPVSLVKAKELCVNDNIIIWHFE